jgi:nitric oxide reductase subunit B
LKDNRISFLFIVSALIALLGGLFFGVIGGLQYVLPDFLREYLAFNKTRPLHVTLVITWIFTAAIGGIYYYLPKISQRKIYSTFLVRAHLILLIVTGISILICYFLGYFGGREYLEFPPILALPMLFTWILFALNYFLTIHKNIREWPIYLWMWTTGVCFFALTFGESYLWKLTFFNENSIRDITVQWKANGSMVGAWNMLVYGTAFYVMEQISGDKKIATSRLTFFFYFLGLTNLMFNWGHHTYIVPAAHWIKNMAYVISMTELLILGNIIRNWRKTVAESQKHRSSFPYRFLIAADFWIFVNLALAILISVPAINMYTHGTHITVAHAMGATIGINTMILFASVFYILSKEFPNFLTENLKNLNIGFWICNSSLFIFWVSLITAGVSKSMQMRSGNTGDFSRMMKELLPVFYSFTLAGISMFIGILLLVIPVIRSFLGRVTLTR